MSEKKPPKKQNLTLRERLWFHAFLETLNASEAARRTFNCRSKESAWKRGSRMYKRLKGVIDAWLEEQGFSDTALKLKLVELMNATQRKYFRHQSEILETEEFPAWAPRARGLEMAMKSKGMLKDRVELSGSVTVNQFSEEELKDAEEAAKIIAQLERERKNGNRRKKNE